ncbi:MAG: hypothetical protein H7235_06785 [Bdellovibrionaceae bacterium]|nr:hypothetical protein [Pseudobdellovibrionaceae bacterium]
MKRISSNLTLILMCFTSVVQAREWTEFYNNSRSNAMGGTKIAISSDDTTLFRNPSNLGSFRGAYATWLDPELETSGNFYNQFTKTLTNVQKTGELLNSNRQQYYHAKLQLTPSYSVRNFGFGLIYKDEIGAIMNAAGTSMDTQYQSDVGIVAGMNYNLWDGRIKIGASVKVINRIEVNNSILDPTTSLNLKDIGSEGLGFGGDLSLMLQAPIAYFPTLAVMAHDVGDMKFDSAAGLRLSTTTRPQVVKQTIDAAISIMPIYSRGFRTVFSIEYRDLQNARDEDFAAKRTHIGAEFNWNDIFYLRLGANQGYATGGIEVASERYSWQLTTYGEEVGTKDATKEDRRFATKIMVRF